MYVELYSFSYECLKFIFIEMQIKNFFRYTLNPRKNNLSKSLIIAGAKNQTIANVGEDMGKKPFEIVCL